MVLEIFPPFRKMPPCLWKYSSLFRKCHHGLGNIPAFPKNATIVKSSTHKVRCFHEDALKQSRYRFHHFLASCTPTTPIIIINVQGIVLTENGSCRIRMPARIVTTVLRLVNTAPSATVR